MVKPHVDPLEEGFGSPEFIEPNPLPATSAEAPPAHDPQPGHLSKDSLGYYLQPFIVYALLIVMIVILIGLILQRVNHQENQITICFWKFVQVVNDFLVAWTSE